MTNSKKKILIFTLGAKTLDKDFGPRYQDVIGMANALTMLGHDVDVADDLSDKEPNDYDKIMIAPRSLTLFKDRPDVIEDVKTQIDFINRMKEQEDSSSSRLILFFDDVALMMDDDYPYSVNSDGKRILDFDSDKYESIFSDLKYEVIFDYEYNPGADYVKDIFMHDKEKQKDSKVTIMNWILLAHLPKIIEASYMKANHSDKDYHLYYGGYRPQVVDSLLELGFGKPDQDNILVGSNSWEKHDHFKSTEYLETMPIKDLRNLISSSKYLYVPDEDKKSGSQLTARIMELILFKSDDSEIVWGKTWNEHGISSLTKVDLLDKLVQAFNDLDTLINA